MFKGIWTALWTPTDQKGAILEEALKHHIVFLKKANIQGIVVGGSTGEFIRLTLKQRQQLLDCVMRYAGSLPILVNISDPVRKNVKALADQAKAHKASGVMVLPPSYYAVSQDDLLAYFLDIASMTQDLPFLLYNFPECVRNNIEIETILHLADSIPLAGIKQSGSHFEYHRQLVKAGREKQFSVLTGADFRLPEALSIGVDGSIGGLSNAIPDLIVAVFTTLDAKAQSQVETIVKTISPLLFPYDIAALMEARGLETGFSKIARSAQSVSLQQRIVKELKVILRSQAKDSG